MSLINPFKSALRCLFGLVVLSALASCQPQEETFTDALSLQFDFAVDHAPFVTDSAQYLNAAGNLYVVNEIKFFISDLKLVTKAGDEVAVTDDESIHYVDYALPHTLCWNLHEPLLAGDYTAVSFTFGLSPKDNTSYRFLNPPENNMSWPASLGGGYHYMQINGKYFSEGEWKPYNFHTGIGQLYDTLGQVTEYIHNDFKVTLPLKACTISSQHTTIHLEMNVNSWFTSPHDYDFEVWGGSIMQNQQAQQVIKENGGDVFTAVVR